MVSFVKIAKFSTLTLSFLKYFLYLCDKIKLVTNLKYTKNG